MTTINFHDLNSLSFDHLFSIGLYMVCSLSQEPYLRSGEMLIHKDLSWSLMNSGEGHKSTVPTNTDCMETSSCIICMWKCIDSGSTLPFEIWKEKWQLFCGSTDTPGPFGYLYSDFKMYRRMWYIQNITEAINCVTCVRHHACTKYSDVWCILMKVFFLHWNLN